MILYLTSMSIVKLIITPIPNIWKNKFMITNYDNM